jgi:hypothetical protein
VGLTLTIFKLKSNFVHHFACVFNLKFSLAVKAASHSNHNAIHDSDGTCEYFFGSFSSASRF